MLCPYCSKASSVENSRKRAHGTEIWRRRFCDSCNQTWTTIERIDLSTTHRVQDSLGHLEPLLRDKLFISIKDSLQHRKSPTGDARYVTDIVLEHLLAQKQPIIMKSDVTTIVTSILRRFDKTASAVYQAKHSS